MLIPYKEWDDLDDLESVYAYWTIGLFPPEDIPWVACHLLNNGFESENTSVVAGLSSPTWTMLNEYGYMDKIQSMFADKGVSKPTDLEAGIRVVSHIARHTKHKDEDLPRIAKHLYYGVFEASVGLGNASTPDEQGFEGAMLGFMELEDSHEANLLSDEEAATLIRKELDEWLRKHPDSHDAINVPGKYYVERGASLNCGTCASVAPNNFTMNEERSTCQVYKQPESDEEEYECLVAMSTSCVGCVHNDGETGHMPGANSQVFPPNFEGGFHRANRKKWWNPLSWLRQ